MKIYLYLNDKIEIYFLPKDVSGSYSFDPDENENSKLINVNAVNHKWVLYSTKESLIMNNNRVEQELDLLPNKFYILKRNNQNYLLSTANTNEDYTETYIYNEAANIIVGMDNSNATFNSPFSGSFSFSIRFDKDTKNLVLNTTKGQYYINNLILNTNQYNIKSGDELSFYGVRIVFIKNYIVVYAINNSFIINNMNSGVSNAVIKNEEEIKNIEIKDRDLYGEEDYYSKSPRIRRTIEEKEIEMSDPPQQDGNKELPLILTMGPMMTMALTSMVTLYTSLSGLLDGTADMKSSAPGLVMGISMLVSMLLWPVLTNAYNKRVKKKREKEILVKYGAYIDKKRKELENERLLQKEIITENVIPLDQCINNIKSGKINFWDKRIDQSDFLVVRVGMGNEKLKAQIDYPKDGFKIDEDKLKKQVDDLKEEFKYIENVPIGYSLYENHITAIMGPRNKTIPFTNNIILQLLSFYSYDDLKIVVITNNKNAKNWDYLKYTSHNMTNDKAFRFFSSNEDSAEIVSRALLQELSGRVEQIKAQQDNEQKIFFKPYYLIIVDDLNMVKKTKLVDTITELRVNLGMSVVILENKLSKLPSLCNNFINLGDKQSGILRNSYEKQEQQLFTDEINYNIDMMSIAKRVANIPIESNSNDDGAGSLPDAINFLEMENVGKVEQLNILNRWNTNDSTTNLKAEVGLGPDGKFMYLDLHEKAHGPHGLIAGMTGSGKSEFIITWILSLCMNFSPEDVAFILIDYKGGGLAFAFENQNARLPHLTGTITNLDKAEINRTLVSIDSEVKRRQKVFNEAREKLGESTIDIYKYQKHFHDGKLDEPLPHLFIVCDEFAELKAQQPDFMDNLISVARIGRSLGVHLILATQKPSGVVNDQIWSNTKFRVCLKVQDASDSNEMLKRPDAASLKQTGRFYLQVGYDEYFALGQSGWCGAKYYPSDTVKKTVDKSVNILDETAQVIKTVQASNGNENQAKEAQGEQLAAVLNEIINTANETNKFAKRLWLENIPPIITIDKTIEKYNIQKEEYKYEFVLGEYDAPELQDQKPLIYNVLDEGNTSIYSTDSLESETVVTAMLYNIINYYTPEEISFYIFDFGSQNFLKFNKVPHCGGVVSPADTEGYNNLFKLIKEEIKERKKTLSEFGGEYLDYIKNNPGKMPIMINVFNNYESLNESSMDFYEVFSEIIRDSERYGIIFVVTASGLSSVPDKAKQLIPFTLALKLKDPTDYPFAFNARQKIEPRDIFGRGICKNEILHEFQTALVCEDKVEETNFLLNLFEEINKKGYKKVKQIPTLPEQVEYENIKDKLKGFNSIPIGIEKGTLSIKKFNMLQELAKVVITSKLKYARSFTKSIIVEFILLKYNVIVIDPIKELAVFNNKVLKYIDSDMDASFDQIIELSTTEKDKETIIIMYSLDKIINSLEDSTKLETFFDEIKKNEKFKILIVDEVNKIKDLIYETWFKDIDKNEGLFIGKGADEQSVLKITTFGKDLQQALPKNFGVYISEGNYCMTKLIEFEREEVDEEDE